MSDPKCNICGSCNYNNYLKFKEGRKVVICNNCRAFRTMPYLLMDYSEQEFYCEHYLKNERIFKGFAETLVKLAKRYKREGKLLDIGCSVGFVLEEASKAGFEAEGVELNKKAAEIVSEKGFDVKSLPLKEIAHEKEVFDVVILNHILEHIFEVNDFMKDVRGLIKKDGILIIGVPNHNSLVARLYKASWYGWGKGEHVWHFDKNSLKNVLTGNGFKIMECIQNSQYYSFSRSFRKNIMTCIAKIGNMLEIGDQLIAVSKKIQE
ncbi:MAG: class I SAM-dependent methyltransferase [Candidatus Omnitrophota bacterium]